MIPDTDLPLRAAPQLVQTSPIVTIRGVSRRYGDVVALRNVDVTVYLGEVLGIVGESGSGKSTLLRMMNLEDVPDTGDYRLRLPGRDDGNLFELERYQQRMLRAHHIGIVYQNPHLGLLMKHSSSGNVAERLLIAGERSFDVLRSKAREALDASEFPLNRMDHRPADLSGGMQQRVRRAHHRARCQYPGAGARYVEAPAARAPNHHGAGQPRPRCHPHDG
jgi:putative phosphonate transport system ATP-binding protein